METYEVISYIANIVFITWGIASILKDRRRNKEVANFFNAAYEMANRLVGSLNKKHAKEQAQDIASFLQSATMNFMNMPRNEIKKDKFVKKINLKFKKRK